MTVTLKTPYRVTLKSSCRLELLEHLVLDRFSSKRSQMLLKRCITAGLLILDDFAFRLYSQQETELLYTLSDERLQEGSIVITSNRPPEDWFSIFPDQIVGGAIMDRLFSGAVKLILTSGRSYRKEGIPTVVVAEDAA